MNQEEKNNLMHYASGHLSDMRNKIQQKILLLKKMVATRIENFRKLTPGDQIVENQLINFGGNRLDELDKLYPSPYFNRIEVMWNDNKDKDILYFAKFPFAEENIYSWVAPAATLRFEKPGEVNYQRPNGSIKKGKMFCKDQYMIVDGKIKFFARETESSGRELIYQEYFSSRKKGFVLPEIVQQMEKAQDKVIRASYRGPFLISGPAGSGKTTLALHRVAYLAQSPDTAEFFPGKSMIILVQDAGTKKYFSHLLPELGINDVKICTFSEWAMKILGLEDMNYLSRIDLKEEEKDNFEWKKLQALKTGIIPQYSKNIFSLLKNYYLPFFTAEEMKIIERQKQHYSVDRFDLSVLLSSYLLTNGKLDEPREYFIKQKNNEVKRRTSRFPLEYSLIVIDEFQNYLPEQLALITGCTGGRFRSIVYVGDMSQQIKIGTVKNWQEISEEIGENRMVVLEKVYRNTKNILQYIRCLGYQVNIPQDLREGTAVTEEVMVNKEKEIQYIKSQLKNIGDQQVGILSFDENYLADFKSVFKDSKNVFCLSINEAQGVEFETVFLVGINQEIFKISSELSEERKKEKASINKDLLYIALTRAMNGLFILGSRKLSNIIH